MARARPSPAPTTILRGHGTGVQAVRFMSKELLLSGSQDGVVKLWQIGRKRTRAEIGAHGVGAGVLRLELHQGGQALLSQGRNGHIKLWDMERLLGGGAGGPEAPPEPVRVLKTGSYHFCQFAMTRWREGPNWQAGTLPSDTSCTEPMTQGSTLSRGNGCAEPSAADDLGSGGTTSPGCGQKDTVALSAGAFAANSLLAPCEDQHEVRLWDLRADRPSESLAPPDPERRGMVMCTRLLGESACLASPVAVCGHEGGALCLYDVRSAAAPLVTAQLHREPVLCVDVGCAGRQGVSGSADGDIHVFSLDLKEAGCVVSKTFSLNHPGTACAEIRPDQRVFVTGGWDHRLRVFSWRKPRPLAVLRAHEESVYCVDYGPVTGVFVAGSKDSRVSIWDIFPGDKAQAPPGEVQGKRANAGMGAGTAPTFVQQHLQHGDPPRDL